MINNILSSRLWCENNRRCISCRFHCLTLTLTDSFAQIVHSHECTTKQVLHKFEKKNFFTSTSVTSQQ